MCKEREREMCADRLMINVQIFSGNAVLASGVVFLTKDENVDFVLRTSHSLDTCAANQHIRDIQFVFTTDFDAEAKLYELGYLLPADLASALLKDVTTYIDEHALGRWGYGLELACLVTERNLRKTSDDYQYTHSDVAGFFGNPRYLKDHDIEEIDGVERSVPKDACARTVLLHEYEFAKTNLLNFDVERFWNGYTWSQLQTESRDMLRAICVTTSTEPNNIHYNCLVSDRYNVKNKPTNGKIVRTLNVYIARCRICHRNDEDDAKREDRKGGEENEKNDKEQIENSADEKNNCAVQHRFSFHVEFRRLDELIMDTSKYRAKTETK